MDLFGYDLYTDFLSVAGFDKGNRDIIDRDSADLDWWKRRRTSGGQIGADRGRKRLSKNYESMLNLTSEFWQIWLATITWDFLTSNMGLSHLNKTVLFGLLADREGVDLFGYDL